MNQATHMLSLKELMNTDFIATDDWRAFEFDGLDDLDFELAGINSMTFEYEDVVDGKRKYLYIEVMKKKDNKWTVKIKSQKNQSDAETKEFDSYKGMLDYVHSIFQKS
jgi:alpha-galactosidase/6-phospho-beta-glucosidase family protein